MASRTRRGFAGTVTKRQKKLRVDGEQRQTLPSENVIIYGPLGVAAELMMSLPSETYMLYAFAKEEDCAAYRHHLKGAAGVFFKRQTFNLRFNVIEEIWERAPKGCIAIMQVVASDKLDWKGVLYIDMMTVRKAWQRHGLNTMMLETAKRVFPGRTVKFSDPTHAGKAFIEAAKARGLASSGFGEG